MCRYTYHHYPNCGHIAHYTVMSCLEFTNQLRMFASADVIFPEPYHLTCDDIKISHDLLPSDHPDLCLQCSYDWSSTYTQNNNANHLPQRNRALEGLDATRPIIDLKARMVVQTNPDPNNLHNKQTDMYQNNPNTVGDDGRYHSSACPAQVGAEQLFMGENTNHTTWGLPVSNFSTSCIPGSNIRFYPELCACCGFDWELYEMTGPHAQLDPDFGSHQEHTSTDVSFDVRDTNDVYSNLHDFGPLFYMPHVDALSCIDDVDNFEPMPGATTDCLAQLDLDCTENSNIDSNSIDLLGALPSHQEIIVELAQAFKTGTSSDENPPKQPHALTTHHTLTKSPRNSPRLPLL
ncbi:hypothetical protein N7454_003171 [Penicillium verhagenii]|nr:hypothetical protein N7454_003171 [Penicillium verhagenii]